ncbi:hypothetical protein J6590_033886 [Homalodisca vitripennis]|nr:hypothetical protein J6590_033886 [Homalodisca vitripennis]
MESNTREEEEKAFFEEVTLSCGIMSWCHRFMIQGRWFKVIPGKKRKWHSLKSNTREEEEKEFVEEVSLSCDIMSWCHRFVIQGRWFKVHDPESQVSSNTGESEEVTVLESHDLMPQFHGPGLMVSGDTKKVEEVTLCWDVMTVSQYSSCTTVTGGR